MKMVFKFTILLSLAVGLVVTQSFVPPRQDANQQPSPNQILPSSSSSSQLNLSSNNQSSTNQNPQGSLPTVTETPVVSPPTTEQQKPNRGFVAVRDTIFRLFTRSNGRLGEIIKLGDFDSLRQSGFNPGVPTRFVIHDWMNEGLSPATTSIRDAYLAADHYNVIIVDWDAGSINPYLAARDSSPAVGRALAQFLDFMVNSGQLNIGQVYLIGYGLGAHIAGVAGKSVTTGRIPVIYALDPIHLRLREPPMFSTLLTHADADYVEVIHTSVLTSHLMRPVGHADFYINYGTHQPGCLLNPIPCSHERAYKYFAESIVSQQGFYGVPCSDFREIVWFRRCRRNAGPLAKMGGEFPQNNRWGLYVVSVNPAPPFARGMLE